MKTASQPADRTASPTAQHTPGPWTKSNVITGDYAIRADLGQYNYLIARMPSEAGSTEERAEREANARLIAATPDLLAALEALLPLADAMRDVLKATHDKADLLAETSPRMDQARAAIARAKV